MTDLRTGWFCDHAPGRGKILGAGLVGGAGKYYFEVQDKGSSAEGGIFIGIAGISFGLEKPFQQDSAPAQAGSANSAMCVCLNNGNINSRSYPNNPFTSGLIQLVADGTDWIGVAVDTVDHKIWWRNASQAPGTWAGSVAATTTDVINIVGGFDFSASGGGPISGNIYIVVGAGYDGSGTSSVCLLNAGASGFAAAPPTGWVGWDTGGTTVLNSVDAAPEIILSGANLQMTTTHFSSTNQQPCFVRSNTSKVS